MHRPAADRTVHHRPGISHFISPQMLFQQQPRQTIAQLAGPVFPFRESDQTVLAIFSEHLIECPPGLFLKLPTPLSKFFAGDSRHG